MEITYLGEESFLVKAERAVAINPGRQGPAADVVLHNVRQNDRRLIVNGPGEYEIGGVLVLTVADGRSRALCHVMEVGGLNVAFVGAGSLALSEREIAGLGQVDVLIVAAADPVAAGRVIGVLEPRVVLPFGAGSQELSAAIGVRDPQQETRFSWNGSGTPPKLVLLKPAGRKKHAA